MHDCELALRRELKVESPVREAMLEPGRVQLYPRRCSAYTHPQDRPRTEGRAGSRGIVTSWVKSPFDLGDC